jgi:diaminopimelate epimerase
MHVAFSKYEGLGNDFIVVEQELSTEQAVALCDRHRGIGGDGALIVGERDGLPSMKVINADGSVPEMCGNGIRCVALHLARKGVIGEAPAEIATDAGPHLCRVIDDHEAVVRRDGVLQTGILEVLMRHASLDAAEIGLVASRPLIDAPIEVGDATVCLTAVSMGNPHAVTFDDVGDARLTLGPKIEKHAMFARGANAGFARITAPRSIELRVFERGAGWTEACGTGACAAAVAAVETGRAPRYQAIAIKLPGGVLSITVGAPGERVKMTGPARHVFDGTVEI